MFSSGQQQADMIMMIKLTSTALTRSGLNTLIETKITVFILYDIMCLRLREMIDVTYKLPPHLHPHLHPPYV